jgi:hypothetical protein
MAIFLFLIGAALWLFGATTFLSAPAVTQEIAGIEIFIAGSVLVIGGAIIDAINKAHTTLALAATSANKYMHPSQDKSGSKSAEEFHG